MQSKISTPEKPDKERSKQRILSAAIKMFSEHSYEKATFKMISEETGLSEALIVKYFVSKRNLAISVASKINDEFYINIDTSKTYESLSDELHALGSAMIQLFNENQTSFFALITLSRKDPHFIKDLAMNISAVSPQPERLKTFQDIGEIPASFDLEIVYQQVVSILQGQIFYSMLSLKLPVGMVEQQVHFLLDMVLYGLSENNAKYFIDNKERSYPQPYKQGIHSICKGDL